MKKLILLSLLTMGGLQLIAQSSYDLPPHNQTPVTADSDSIRYEQIEDTTDIFGTSLKPSQRLDGAIIDIPTTRQPLAYEKLYNTNAYQIARIWRIIDITDSINSGYFKSSFSADPNSSLAAIILKSIKNDSLQAFSPIDDRFTTPITYKEAVASFGGGVDTSAVYDLDGNIASYQIREKTVNIDSITQYLIKEDYIFSKKDGRLFIRILGLAPMLNYGGDGGLVYNNHAAPIFWVYYPDLRHVLANVTINNTIYLGNPITYEQIFENGLFNSHIYKSSFDAQLGFKKYPLSSAEAITVEQHLKEALKKPFN